MSHYFHATLQFHNFPVDYAREPIGLKPSKDLASLPVCNEKNLGFFMSDVISAVCFWTFLLISPGFGTNYKKEYFTQVSSRN